jgi:formyltetrahydrofolate synthetase
MKRLFILVILSISFSITTNGQNLVFIGENSYQGTETFTLQSNSDDDYIPDLSLVFAKGGEGGLLIVSSKLVSTVRISGKLIVYLDDGTVITCIDKSIKDNVDEIATSAYYLTNVDLDKLKKSNINTIRYMIKCAECLANPLYEGNYSASNKGSSKTDFTKVTSDFYKD